MIFRTETHAEYMKRFDTWERWYAWHPVSMDGYIVWFSYVERKLERLWFDVYWAYRLPAEVRDV